MSGPVMIVDYGLGNLRSVFGAVAKLGFEPQISSDPVALAGASRLILPGVGAFGDGMDQLRCRDLVPALQQLALNEHRPILGICLGAQLMAKEGEEFGRHQGLGWIDASVRRIEPADAAIRVPHVGWNAVHQSQAHEMFANVPQDELFYFVHSYHIVCDDPEMVVGTVDYGGAMTAAFRHGNIWGTQFHPEKSQQCGLTLLNNFLRS